jgi:hypothetical protein
MLAAARTGRGGHELVERAQVAQAIVDKATGHVLEREAGHADGSFKQVDVLEYFTTMPLTPRTAKPLEFRSHHGAKVRDDAAHKAHSRYWPRASSR